MEAEYRQLWRDCVGNGMTDGDLDEEPPVSLLEQDLPALVARAIQEGGEDVTRYDAILVDEGQDYNLEWWNVLRRVLRPGGEMMLTADKTQDLYGRSSRWTDGSLENAGFRGGNWFPLEGSYRFPPGLIPHLRRFAEQYLSGKDIDLPTIVQGKLLETVQLRWIQVPAPQAAEVCIQAVYDLTQAASPAVPWSDIILLVRSHKFGWWPSVRHNGIMTL